MKSSLSEHCIFEQNYFPGWQVRGACQVKKMTRYLRALTCLRVSTCYSQGKLEFCSYVSLPEHETNPNHKENSLTFHIQTIVLAIKYWPFKFTDVENLSLVYTMTLCPSSAQSQDPWRLWAHTHLVLLMPVLYVLFSLSWVDFGQPKWTQIRENQDAGFQLLFVFCCFVLFYFFKVFINFWGD